MLSKNKIDDEYLSTLKSNTEVTYLSIIQSKQEHGTVSVSAAAAAVCDDDFNIHICCRRCTASHTTQAQPSLTSARES